MPRCLSRTILCALSLAIPQIAAADEPRIIGTAQIGKKFLAYLLPPGSTVPVQLVEGENASPDTWRILEIHRGPQNEPLRLLIQHGSQRQWLAVSGGTAPAPGTEVRRAETAADTAPLIDVPVSPHGRLHDQALLRSRIKNKPSARAASRLPSDLDPFPTKLARPASR